MWLGGSSPLGLLLAGFEQIRRSNWVDLAVQAWKLFSNMRFHLVFLLFFLFSQFIFLCTEYITFLGTDS